MWANKYTWIRCEDWEIKNAGINFWGAIKGNLKEALNKISISSASDLSSRIQDMKTAQNFSSLKNSNTYK